MTEIARTASEPLQSPAAQAEQRGVPATTETLRRLLADALAGQRAALEGELAEISAQIAELSRRLVALDRRLPACVRRLEALRRWSDLEAFAAAELERLCSLPAVQAVAIEDSTLLVVTEPIELTWEGRTYRLGRYRLVLDLTGDVRIESLDRLGPRAGWDHPHIQGGLPCLGNLREGVLKLIAEYELALATQVLLDFLTSYQPDTAYTPIEGWPRSS